jgi:hypothetical protein
MRLVLLRFGQVLEMFVGLGYGARNDVTLGSPGAEVYGFAAVAAEGVVLLFAGSSLPADRAEFGTFRHDVRRKS